MKILTVAGLLTATLLLSGAGFSQIAPHSGILHTATNGEQLNLIKIHCDQLADATLSQIISAELLKYDKEVKAVDIDAPNHKIYVKYTNDMSANMLLGILERSYFKAYYHDASGAPVYYTKTGNEVFLR